MRTSPQFLRFAAVGFALGAMLGPLAVAVEDERLLSQIVAEGIGKRFPATSGPVSYDRWPTPLWESPGAMMTAAIAADGSAVATGCGHPNQPGELVLWDSATGKPRWIRPFPRGIRSVAFTADGRRLAAGSFDGLARLHDAASGKILREFRGHSDAINGIALDPGGRWLVTGSHDQTVILWNLADGSQMRTFRGHSADVLTVAISASGKLLASAGRDNTIRIWNRETGEAVHTLTGHEGLIEMVDFSPDDARLASASWDSTLRVWDMASGAQQALLRRGARLTSATFAPGGKEIWSGGFDGQIAAWEPGAEAASRTLRVQNGAAYAVALSADGSRIVTCGFEGAANLWKSDGTLIHRLERRRVLTGDAGRVVHAVWSGNEDLVATVHGDGVLRFTSAADRSAAGELRIDGARILRALFAADGKTLYAATDRGGVHRWNPTDKTGVQPAVVKHADVVTALALSPDGSALVSCGQDGSIEVHSTKDGKSICRAKSDSPANCATVDATGKVITGHADGRVRWWQTDKGGQIVGEINVNQPVHAVVVVAEAKLAVAAGPTIVLLDVASDSDSVKATSRRVLTVPDVAVTHLAFAPGSQQIASGDASGQVRIWPLTGGGAQVLGKQHEGGVTALAVSPASQTLLTAGDDGAVWLWHPLKADDSIRPLASIPAHEKGTRYVALAKESRLVSDGYDNHVRVWNLATGQEERDLGVPDSASASILLPGGKRVAVGHWSKRIRLVELASGQQLDNIRGLPRGPYAIDLSPKHDRMAAVFRELGALVYDLTAIEADPVVTLPPDELPFTHVAFSPDGATFVTCTGDYQRMELGGKVRLHDTKTGTVLRSFVGHSSEVKFAAFDADGKRLVTAGGDKTVRIWDVASGKMLALLPHSIGTFAPTFVPESDLVLSADYHGKVYVWDLTKTAPVQVVAGHSDLVNRMSLSDDMSVLATGSRDGTVKLWRLAGRGNELRIVDAREVSTP